MQSPSEKPSCTRIRPICSSTPFFEAAVRVLSSANHSASPFGISAAASFIKNGPDVKKITSEALPPGVLPEPENEVKTAEMAHGDMLVMMSDGVLMGLGQDDDRNEEKMAEFLKSCQAVNPQELANAILNHAMAACHYEAEDDMTVLVCGLYRKPKL